LGNRIALRSSLQIGILIGAYLLVCIIDGSILLPSLGKGAVSAWTPPQLDEMSEKDIRPEHILTYKSGNKYIGYVASATVKKEYALHFRELLQSIFDFFCSRYPDIQIRKLYAYASSPEGWDLIKRLFFTPRRDINRNAFELDPCERNPSSYLKAFQNCLKAKGATIFEPEW
jgi:hypothetical protein